MQEQNIMNLSWYKNIKTLLKLDNLYHMDHVSAFKHLHQEKDITTDSSQHSNHINNSQLNKYKHLKPINPISCKKYRIEPIMKSLKDHSKSIWKQEKEDSAKLFLFYNKIKLDFEKEPYLDFVKNAKSRYCTTRLKISAHNLEIEYGRYKNIPREQRKCRWCDLASNTSHLENEHHVFFECDLYANIRSKLVRTLNNTMGKIDCNLEIGRKNTSEQYAFRAISVSNLSKHILEIQSNCENYLAQIATGINQNT